MPDSATLDAPPAWTPPMDKPAMPAWQPPMDKPAAKPEPEPANSPWKALASFAISNPVATIKVAQDIASTPAAQLPRVTYQNVPNLPQLGPLNPRLQAHVWNEGIAPALEFQTSPEGMALGMIGGGLKGASAVSAGAKAAYRGIAGIFGTQMLWAFAKRTPETYHAITNPKSTFDDIASAVTKQVADGTWAILSGLSMLEKGGGEEGGNEGASVLKDIAQKQPSPAEAVQMLRSQAEIAKPEQALALHVAADRIEEHTAPQPPASDTTPTILTKEEGLEPMTKEAALEKANIARGAAEEITPITAKAKVAQLTQQVQDMMRLIGKQDKATPEGLRELDRMGRDDAKAIRKSLLDIADEVPMGQRGKFNAAITDAMNRPALGHDPDGMYRRAMHVMFRMMDAIDEGQRKDLVSDIRKSMDKALDSPMVDVEYKKRIQQEVGRTAFKTLSDERRAKLSATRDFIAKQGEESKVPQDMVAQLDMLTQTPAKELPMDTLKALKERVDLLAKLGRTIVRSREALYESEKSSLTGDIRSGDATILDERAMQRSPGVELPAAKEAVQTIGNKVSTALNYADKIGRSLLTRDVVMDVMDGNAKYRGPITRIFGGRIDLDYNAEMNLRRAFQRPLEEILEKNRYTGTEGERISIYAIAREENGIQRLRDSGVTQETINHVNATFTPKEMEFYSTARRLFDETIYPALKKFMRDTYNVDVKQTPNYWPFQRDPALVEPDIAAAKIKAESGETTGFDEMATWRQLQQDFVPRMSTKAEKGMTIERVPEATGAVRLNALDVVDRHIRQVSHLLANQRDLKMLGEIARQDWFRDKYGRLGQDYILKLLDTVARDASPAGSTRTAWLDWLTKNTSVAIIGLRVLSQMKHLPNVAFSLKNVRLDYLVRGLVEALRPEGRAFVTKNFSEIAQRYGGEPAIADVAQGNLWRKMQGGSFVFERALDAMDARATVLGRYFQELEGKGVDHREYAKLPVDKEAQRMALLLSRQTVTSPLRKDVPQAISRGTLTGGQMSWTRAMFQFQNTMLRQMGYVRHDIWDLGLKKLDFQQFTVATLAFLAMLTGETTIVRANKKLLGARPQRGQEDSFAQDMAIEALRRVPAAGNLVGAFEHGESGIPTVDTLIQGAKNIGQLAMDKGEYGHKLSPKAKEKAEVGAAGMVGEVLGIPGASTATQVIKNKTSRDPWTTNR